MAQRVELSERLLKDCKSGKSETVLELISRGANPLYRDWRGWTPLQYASWEGHLDILKLLITKGHCDVNRRGEHGNTPLHDACSKGYLNIVKWLITETRCDVNIRTKYGNYPLHLACSNGHIDITKWLITEGHYDVNIKDNFGNTPSYVACRKGHFDIVKWLITEGHSDVKCSNEDGNTLLHCACREGHLDISTWLITEGHCDANTRNKSGRTPIQDACRNHHFELVWYLVRNKHCSVELQWSDAQALLDWAHRNGVLQHLDSEQLCHIILEKDDAEALLLWASKKGQLEVVKYLTSKQHCNIQCMDDYGQTPLQLACREGHLDILTWLITEGHCDANTRNKSGSSPIQDACRNHHFELVWYLVRNKHCSVKLQWSDAQALLDWAHRKGVLQHLDSEQFCDIFLEKYNAEALLLWASKKGHLEVVKYLTSKQHCNVQCMDAYGQTPLQLACRNGCAKIVHYLLSERMYDVKKDDRTLLNLTNDPSTIRELLRHGANPENVYAQYSHYLPKQSPKQPPASAVKIFTVGDHGAGKSTLVKALEKEGSGLSRIAGRLTKVKGVDEKTAGIIPHSLKSRSFGHAALYDFAGHKEFYASHAAMIRQSMAGSSTAVFLLLVDLRSSDEQFEGTILSWLSFIDNQCPLDPKPHIIIVGSHADEIESKDLFVKNDIVNSLKDTDAFANFDLQGYIAINCCYSQSTSISQLRQRLAKSCEVLRPKSKPSFNTHCFFLYLLDKFRDLEAVKFKDVLIKVSENSALSFTESDHGKLLSFIPTDTASLCEMCEDLHDRGNILLLRSTGKPEESWIILDQTSLLAKVTGKVFAPKHFKEHQDLASITGLVPFTKFKEHLPSLNPDMVSQFLCHLEFCQQVTDDEVLKLLQAPVSITCEERVFFFPSLVSIEAPEFEKGQIPAHTSPTQVWKPSSNFVYNSGWILQCSKAEHHFTPRFLQVLLLRLAFCFALAPHIQEIRCDLPEIRREFDVWKCGICWHTRNGVGALIEMDKSGKVVTVLLRCLEGREVECIHLRSAIIHKVLCAREKFCPKVSTSEYFMHPDVVEYPLKPTTELNLFSISEITRAIEKGNSCVIGKDKLPLDIQKLLYFEPYIHLSVAIIKKLFEEDKDTCSCDVDEFIHQMAQCFNTKLEYFREIFLVLKLPIPTAMQQTPPSSVQAIISLLQLWYLRSKKGGYQCLRRELDQFSVFATRNPLSPTTSSLSAQSAAETTSEVDSTTDHYSTIIDTVDETTLGIESLLEVRAELREANMTWFDLGLALGLLQHTLKSIQNEYGNNHCLTEILAAWLQGRDGAAAPNWRAIVKALLCPTINFYRLALQISNAHPSDSGSLMTGSERRALQDVDNAQLDESSLIEVKATLLAGGRHLAWFELGLALGLYYGTLKIVQSEHINNDQCLTGTLEAWLKQKDRVPQQGVPSWHSLTRALAHPLVSQQGLAQEIARKHLKVNSEEIRSHTGKEDWDNSQKLPTESFAHSSTFHQDDEDRGSSISPHRLSDPLTTDVVKPFEQVSKNYESILAQKDVIDTPPEGMATASAATKVTAVLSSTPPSHTPPLLSEQSMTAGQQEIAKMQDTDVLAEPMHLMLECLMAIKQNQEKILAEAGGTHVASETGTHGSCL